MTMLQRSQISKKSLWPSPGHQALPPKPVDSRSQGTLACNESTRKEHATGRPRRTGAVRPTTARELYQFFGGHILGNVQKIPAISKFWCELQGFAWFCGAPTPPFRIMREIHDFSGTARLTKWGFGNSGIASFQRGGMLGWSFGGQKEAWQTGLVQLHFLFAERKEAGHHQNL